MLHFGSFPNKLQFRNRVLLLFDLRKKRGSCCHYHTNNIGVWASGTVMMKMMHLLNSRFCRACPRLVLWFFQVIIMPNTPFVIRRIPDLHASCSQWIAVSHMVVLLIHLYGTNNHFYLQFFNNVTEFDWLCDSKRL